MVLKYCLSANTLYILGHIVDRECDTLIESFVVYSPFVGQVGLGCEGNQGPLFLMPRCRVNYAMDESIYARVYKRLSK